jgi:putative peptide maturation dehydrogenase
MKVFRPPSMMFELRQGAELDLESLLSAEPDEAGRARWFALAPHLDAEVRVDLQELAALQAASTDGTSSQEDLAGRFGAERIERLLAAGLLLDGREAHRALHARVALLEATQWWTPSLVAHAFSRWQGVDVEEIQSREGPLTVAAIIEANGPPPAAALSTGNAAQGRDLPLPAHSPLDTLLASRSTCRNFTEAALPIADLATTLHRVFAAQGVLETTAGAAILKKNSPSGGSMHPIEAFVLAQRVEGLEPGLYHYHCTNHALEPLRAMSAQAAGCAAHELVAGQAWFANAPVLVLMAARYQRNFWKYRNHAKAWKVVQLDAGHLSQNLYLSATEQGYGAFITAAINDECAERLFGLDGLGTGAVAVCGFGKRAADLVNVEFDPLGRSVR